jgi:type IV pilus assembly protein PilP
MSEHRMKLANLTFSMLLIVAAVGTVAQTPPATTDTAAAATTATTATGDVQKTLEEILEEPTSTDTYRYDPQGRRDPFRSLIGPAPKTDLGQRPPGIPGFLIDELKLQGVIKTRYGLAAMLSGPDNNGYLVRVGQKTFDGELIRITPNSVVFRQEVNDPTRIERYREVVKELNPGAKR